MKLLHRKCQKKLTTATLSVREGTPISLQFDDIYFSPIDGVGESKYHFLQGNHLYERFAENKSTSFTVAETGFGTGLNFLLTAELWQKTAPIDRQLHYISVEKYPIPIAYLQAIYRKKNWENAITRELLANYPQPKQGVYDIAIGKNIQLTLLFGDAVSQFSHYEFTTDAWFLDGFAPAKNPEMWSDALYQSMARHSQKGTTFATFTAASSVRRGLINVGFTVEKGKGFGKKRERLLGYVSDDHH